ncbi:MAG: hypothetical protein AAB114_06840, partial [Chloroflexota bacterium]
MTIGRNHRDHALRRGPYRSLRRKGKGHPLSRSLAIFPPFVIAFVLTLLALPLIGGLAAFAFFAADLPAPQDLAKDPLAQSTKVYDRTGSTLLYQFEIERREIVTLGDVPQVLLIQLDNLQLGEQELGERDGDGLEREALEQRNRVAHAESAYENVDLALMIDVGEEHAAIAVQ